ncbi:GGDEF domain-containing protein [Konateibacter massiliensis]|uniref:GGDEF domain-containing protein n=1 Tax=Konateibacter massiliensis TaxID=2002841 RepID=UPI000C154CA9|nr:GGDEF domain-containing protein [Konateibacter massiliensis]
MIEKITLDKLQKNLDFFNKMYDMVRLVDPIHKRVIEYRSNGTEHTCENCYAYWESGQICENCVSVRAYREQKSFIKLEHSPNAVMLVTALPIDSAQQPVVLELLKNATDTMMIGTGDYNKGETLFNAVQDMNDMIIRDELTSLYNRRFIDERLPADIVSAVANQKPLSLIFIDIDNMKTTNDALGHPVGDKLLMYASKIIKESILTKADWAARYGGDEFVICLNNTDEETAFHVSQQIENNFSKAKFLVQDSEITIKASLGVTTMPESGLTAEELINLADKNMYKSKKLHRKN